MPDLLARLTIRRTEREGSSRLRRSTDELQRLSWQHGCADPSACRNAAGLPARRGTDCPKPWEGGLEISEPKSTAGRRTLTLPPTLTAELRTYRRAQLAEQLASEVWKIGPHGGWVFANPRGGPLDPRADAPDFKHLCEHAGVPPKRLHDLRHSAATMMLAGDLDLRTAGAVPGHSQIALTARYSHIPADRRSVAASRIERTLLGTSTDR
jgi:integrase